MGLGLLKNWLSFFLDKNKVKKNLMLETTLFFQKLCGTKNIFGVTYVEKVIEDLDLSFF